MFSHLCTNDGDKNVVLGALQLTEKGRAAFANPTSRALMLYLTQGFEQDVNERQVAKQLFCIELCVRFGEKNNSCPSREATLDFLRQYFCEQDATDIAQGIGCAKGDERYPNSVFIHTLDSELQRFLCKFQ